MSINGVGEKFDLEKLKAAQKKTKEIVRDIASKCFVGMSENDGHNLIDEEFKKVGEIKFWHPHKFRIGKNTIKSFREESDLAIKLQENDIFFIDIGPILYEHEGDYGDTFVFGENNDFKKLKVVSKELFELGKKEFLEKKLSGYELYELLEVEAKKRNVVLNLKTLGHRVGDFPHHLYYRGKMKDVEELILPNLWVLEIQISNVNEDYGAFFEDILFE